MVKPDFKNILRNQYLSLRDSYPSSLAISAANIINNRLLEIISNFGSHLIVAAYYPIRNEVNVLPLISDLIDIGYKVALPSIINSKMKFLHCEDLKLLKRGFYNIPEPSGEELIPNLILAPLIACDRNFNRLGYGKGFYDKTIQLLRNTVEPPLVIGVAYHFQLVEILPVTNFDQKLDIIVTEQNINYRKS